ncbi:MAG: response regulator [Gemmatimonadales bacterium]
MKTATIMVVDDDRSMREGAAGALRAAGYEVLEAGSGSSALALLADHTGKLDLLLTDVQMQNMSGGELAESVQADHPDVRVLFMSGYTSGAALHDSVREDGVAFIAKPFVSETLLKKVRALLKG